VPLPPLDELARPSGGALNRRAEMWMKSKAWLELEGGVQVPDSDSLQADAGDPSYRYDARSRGRWRRAISIGGSCIRRAG